MMALPHGWYVEMGASDGIAGFPVALTVEREPDLEWLAVHVLLWFLAVARRRGNVAAEERAA